ncbi:hypothetical protein BFN02_13220 [Staphylococcus equorum]|nr:hypothetical protein BFN02_13220 [Staphylococcus equorum]
MSRGLGERRTNERKQKDQRGQETQTADGHGRQIGGRDLGGGVVDPPGHDDREDRQILQDRERG